MTHNSPTSIIVYNQCPRLYFHQYISRKPSFPHIDLIQGCVIHETLKDFFSERPSNIETDPKNWARSQMLRVFMNKWSSKKSVLNDLHLTTEEIRKHYHECQEMILHWLDDFLERLDKTHLQFDDAFEKLTPITEEACHSQEYDVTGYIDVIEKNGDEVRIIDYKTSSKFEITKEHRLQLAIYAFLFKKKYQRMPDKVGIYFLREKIHLISVDEHMIQFAEAECKKVHEKTQSTSINDYPQNVGYLCRSLRENCPCRKYD